MQKIISDPFTLIAAMAVKSLLSLIIVGVAVWPIFDQVSAKTPTNILVNKCCPSGYKLNEYRQCMAGSTEHWWPIIYLPNKGQYYDPKGDAPRFIKSRENVRPSCESPEIITTAHALLANGTLYLSDRLKFIEIDHFCIDHGMALVCEPTVENAKLVSDTKNRTILRKCCSPNELYDSNTECLALRSGAGDLATVKLIEHSADHLEFRYGVPQCSGNGHNIAIVGKFNETALDMSTGSLTLTEGNFRSDQFCLEHINDSNALNVHVFTCTEYLPNTHMKTTSRFTLSLIGCTLLISVVFLIATLATGFLLPTNHHVLHWRCQTYYVACLIVGDILLAIVQLSGNAIKVKSAECVSIAISVHFFYLVAFFWLNAMCFNIYWTFRDFRPSSLEKVQELMRLRIYQAYAWGVPVIIMTIAIILDNLPNEVSLRPRFGQTRCGFDGDKELLAYFFGPIGFLLFVNLLLFASTARQLTCGLWKRDDVKSTTERAALGRVCMKLVVVMGITWITDVISWVHVTFYGDRHAFWIVPDLINALHGVFIFIVVGCQPQVLMAIKRFWCSKVARNTTNTTNGPQHSSSSQGLPSIGESVTNNTFTNNSTFTTSIKAPLETVC